MLVIFGFLIIITSVVLGLIVLIQNPKGGGLSGTFGGFSNQLMGVKQTTDVLEKGTWVFVAVLGLLCLFSQAFIPKHSSSSSANDETRQGMTTTPQKKAVTPVAPPAAPVPVQQVPAPVQAPAQQGKP